MHPLEFRPDHPLSDWPNCRLEMRCSYGRIVVPAVSVMLPELGNHTFEQVLPRLRCRGCRGRPGPVYLCASHHRKHTGGPTPDWAIELVPAPTPITSLRPVGADEAAFKAKLAVIARQKVTRIARHQPASCAGRQSRTGT